MHHQNVLLPTRKKEGGRSLNPPFSILFQGILSKSKLTERSIDRPKVSNGKGWMSWEEGGGVRMAGREGKWQLPAIISHIQLSKGYNK